MGASFVQQDDRGTRTSPRPRLGRYHDRFAKNPACSPLPQFPKDAGKVPLRLASELRAVRVSAARIAVGIPSLEASSLTVSRESVTAYDDMRLPALLVAIELLTQDGGHIFERIRGRGLA